MGIGPRAFVTRGRSPWYWEIKAEEFDRLVRLALKAYEDDWQLTLASLRNPDYYSKSSGQRHGIQLESILFLAAVAIENLLKGILVIKNPATVSKGRLQGPVICTHDLLKIAHEAGVALERSETDFCKLGTGAILQYGRYSLGKARPSHWTA
jgi:hypothetical protein